jgi:hypothetical protein
MLGLQKRHARDSISYQPSRGQKFGVSYPLDWHGVGIYFLCRVVKELNYMSSTDLIRLGGLAAIIAGILRGISALIPASSTAIVEIEVLYLVTDIFILFGLMGLYGFQYTASGLWGFFGFMLGIIGIGTIRTGAISGVYLYPIGALIFAGGLILFAVGSWIASKLPRWVSIFWVLSTLLGILGYFGSGLNIFFVISGLIFGIGFSGAGITIWSETKNQRQREISKSRPTH